MCTPQESSNLVSQEYVSDGERPDPVQQNIPQSVDHVVGGQVADGMGDTFYSPSGREALRRATGMLSRDGPQALPGNIEYLFNEAELREMLGDRYFCR